jgi:hypothetical protein
MNLSIVVCEWLPRLWTREPLMFSSTGVGGLPAANSVPVYQQRLSDGRITRASRLGRNRFECSF